MTQRRDILPQQLSATAATDRRLQEDHVMTLIGGQKRALMFGVARLPPGFALRRGLASWRLGVRMFGTGRQRGVTRRLVEPLFQLLNLR